MHHFEVEKIIKERPFFLLCLSRSASMHVQLLVKVNNNMITTTIINFKWNSLGRKRGSQLKKGHKIQLIFVIVEIFWKDFFECFFFLFILCNALWGFLHVKSALIKMMKLKTQQKNCKIGLYFLEKMPKIALIVVTIEIFGFSVRL